MNSKDDVIYSYTRAQAIADGVLIDVTETAKEAGFRFPVALTHAVWSGYVVVPSGVECQDETGRLWDILNMLSYAIRSGKPGGPELLFQLYVRNDNQAPELVTLKCICGPGEQGEPVMTVMNTDED